MVSTYKNAITRVKLDLEVWELQRADSLKFCLTLSFNFSNQQLNQILKCLFYLRRRSYGCRGESYRHLGVT
jgi:hypothetical protein